MCDEEEDYCEAQGCRYTGQQECEECYRWLCLDHISLRVVPDQPTIFLCEECLNARQDG